MTGNGQFIDGGPYAFTVRVPGIPLDLEEIFYVATLVGFEPRQP